MVNRYTTDRQDPPRRRVHARRRRRTAAGPRACIVYAAALPRGVRRRADRDRRHRGQPAPHRALRLLVRQGAALGAARLARRTCWSTATPSARSSRSRTGWRPARRRSRHHATCAAPRSAVRGPAPRAGPRSTRRAIDTPGRIEPAPAIRTRCARRTTRASQARAGGRRAPMRSCRARSCEAADRPRATAVMRLPASSTCQADPVLYAHASRVLHLESNPGNARALVQRHGDRDVWLNPPPLPLATDGDGPRLRAAVRARAAPELRRRQDPGVRDDPVLGHDHARLLRRLHLLLDHRARGPHHPEPLARRRSCARSSAIRDTTPGFTGVISDLGGPTANMYRLACKSPAIEAACRLPSCVYPGHLREPRHRPRAADPALPQGARAARRQEGAGRVGRALRPGRDVARVRARARAPTTSAAT